MSDYISREELKRTLKPFVIKKGVMENINAIPSARVIEISKLENIINNTTIQEDVIRYQMICEVIKNERKAES